MKIRPVKWVLTDHLLKSNYIVFVENLYCYKSSFVQLVASTAYALLIHK